MKKIFKFFGKTYKTNPGTPIDFMIEYICPFIMGIGSIALFYTFLVIICR